MDRISGAGHVNHRFVTEDAATNRPPTEVTDVWLNGVQEEIVSLIESAGLLPSGADNSQLSTAIKSIFQRQIGTSCNATGSADAIVGSFIPAITTLPAVGAGLLTLYVRAASANATTNPTFTPNIGIIAAKPIVKSAGSALVAGDIAGAGHLAELQYDATLDKWVLLNPAGGTGNKKAATIYTASQMLTAAAFGCYVEYISSTAAGTFTLPSAAICPGGVIDVYNGSSIAGYTLTLTGGGNFYGANNTGGTSSYVLQPQCSATLISDGSNWKVINGSGVASKTTNGYVKLPNGLIIQWGQATASTSAPLIVTYPIAFPNQFLQVYATTDTTAPYFAATEFATNTQVGLDAYNNSGARVAVTVRWLAIGF